MCASTRVLSSFRSDGKEEGEVTGSGVGGTRGRGGNYMNVSHSTFVFVPLATI